MTKGKRQRRRQRAAASTRSAGPIAAEEPAWSTPTASPRASAPDRGPMGAATDQPPWSTSLIRGMAAVGRSPVVLAVVTGTVALLWVLYSSSGIVHVASPGVLAQSEAIPPVHSLIDVAFVLTASRALPTSALIGIAGALLVLRSLLLAFLVGFGLAFFATEGTEVAHLRSALLRLGGTIGGVAALEVVFAVAVYALERILVPLFSSLAQIVVLFAATYFLAYAPVVLVAERSSVLDALKTSARVPRLPGRSHALFSFVYSFAAIIQIDATLSPASLATPSVTVWVYALLLSFVHASVLFALVYRWLLVRQPVLQGKIPPSRWSLAPRGRAGGAG